MSGSRRKGTAVLLLCIGLSALWSCAIREKAHARGKLRMVDLAAIYYGARCVMHHEDPYEPAAFLREYEASYKGKSALAFNSKADQTIVTVCINLPTSLFLVAPLALLPWGLAQNLWMILIAGLLGLAASLIWDLGACASPVVWVCLAGFLLLNWELPLVIGNLAGIAVSLCIVATWCFLKDRYVWVGVVLLAMSLVMKPHDAGFVWLYFLLAGGALRKRALQTLILAAILGLGASVWIAPSSPHWMHELPRNIAAASAPDTVNYPGLSGASMQSPGPIISLQSTLSVLWENPHFFNPVSYFIAGLLILIWIIKVLSAPPSPERTRLALAAISILTLLPVYHRPDDASLLLLVIPACATLWAGKSPTRVHALVLTSAGIFFASGIPLALLGTCAKRLSISTSALPGKLATVFLLRPTPLVLLVMGCFYLWAFIRYNPGQTDSLHETTTGNSPAAITTRTT